MQNFSLICSKWKLKLLLEFLFNDADKLQTNEPSQYLCTASGTASDCSAIWSSYCLFCTPFSIPLWRECKNTFWPFDDKGILNWFVQTFKFNAFKKETQAFCLSSHFKHIKTKIPHKLFSFSPPTSGQRVFLRSVHGAGKMRAEWMSEFSRAFSWKQCPTAYKGTPRVSEFIVWWHLNKKESGPKVRFLT